jgi:hypothetical protein
MLRGQATALFLTAIVVTAFSPGTAAHKVAFAADLKGAGRTGSHTELVAQGATPTPNGYIPYWNGYTPNPVPGANAGIEDAFAAGNVYDSGALGLPGGHPSGLGMLQTGLCNFVCFAGPSDKSHHIVAFGSDSGPDVTAFSHFGAANNCDPTCAGQIKNEAFGITLAPTPRPTNDGHYFEVDYQGDLGVASKVDAGAAVIAGTGDGVAGSTPYPSPSSGSLVSHTGPGTGDVLLGDSSNYVKCDYSETTPGSLTCGAPLWSAASPSASPGPVPPCYQNVGTACTSTFHNVKNTADLGIKTSLTAPPCANNAWCVLTNNVISLSSSAVFASNNYGCSLSSFSTIKLTFTVNAQSTTSFTIQAYNNSGSSISSGTSLGINYICSGT